MADFLKGTKPLSSRHNVTIEIFDMLLCIIMFIFFRVQCESSNANVYFLNTHEIWLALKDRVTAWFAMKRSIFQTLLYGYY